MASPLTFSILANKEYPVFCISTPLLCKKTIYFDVHIVRFCQGTFTQKGRTMVTNLIRELREKQGITRDQLARDLQVTRQTIIAMEGNRYYPSLVNPQNRLIF